jgi:hypothetical protein
MDDMGRIAGFVILVEMLVILLAIWLSLRRGRPAFDKKSLVDDFDRHPYGEQRGAYSAEDTYGP